MQANPNPRHECEVAAVQRAVLSLVLEAHPQTLTIPEVAREFEPGDAEHAVRDLVSVGLLECGGISIRPSAAALRFDRLELP
jgi:hypothetical protein